MLALSDAPHLVRLKGSRVLILPSPDPEMTPATAQLLCRLSMCGLSVRAIAKRTRVPKSTVHDCLKKRLGEKAENLRQGSFLIVDEHLQRGSLTRKQQSEVRTWLAENEGRIMQIDMQSNRRLMTVKRERELTRRECGSRADWREAAYLPKDFDDAA